MLASATPIFARANAESGHWYDAEGNPAYTVKSAKGIDRATTLADARKFGLFPSVTTIQKIKAAPALTNWLIEQAILAALTLPRIDGEAERDYIARVKLDGQAQGKAAAEEGTRIHNAIEDHFNGARVPEFYVPHVQGVLDCLAKNFPHVTDWVSEASFAHPAGYGGKIDLHSPSTGIVIDYKGKDCKPGDTKRLAYDNHVEQLAAYHRGRNLPRNVCANIFVSRDVPGHCVLETWTPEEVDQGWSVFEALLETWKRCNKYNPASVKIAA